MDRQLQLPIHAQLSSNPVKTQGHERDMYDTLIGGGTFFFGCLKYTEIHLQTNMRTYLLLPSLHHKLSLFHTHTYTNRYLWDSDISLQTLYLHIVRLDWQISLSMRCAQRPRGGSLCLWYFVLCFRCALENATFIMITLRTKCAVMSLFVGIDHLQTQRQWICWSDTLH